MSLFTLFHRARLTWIGGNATQHPRFVETGLAALNLAEEMFHQLPIKSVHDELNKTQHELEDVSTNLVLARRRIQSLEVQHQNDVNAHESLKQMLKELRAEHNRALNGGGPEKLKAPPGIVPPLADEQWMSPTRTNARSPMEQNQREEIKRLRRLLDPTPVSERLQGSATNILYRLLHVDREMKDGLEPLFHHADKEVRTLAHVVGNLQRALSNIGWEPLNPEENPVTEQNDAIR